VIVFALIPLLTGKALFDVQAVQAERAAGVPTVFPTNLVNAHYTTNPTTATTTGVHMSSGYGTANQANTANTNHKGVSSTTTAHNTANNDAVFGAFLQTAGKTTTSTVKTDNAGVAKRTATIGTLDASTSKAGPTSTSTADPPSTTTSTIAHPVADPAVSLGAHKVTLIEVVIPIVILGILAAVAIPQYIDLTCDPMITPACTVTFNGS
jgi:hypothetical protein